MDALQRTNTQWKLQASPFIKTARETVEVVAQVVVPPLVLTGTARGYNMVIRDTSSRSDFVGVFVRMFTAYGGTGSDYRDSTLWKNNSYTNLEKGDIIGLLGWVDEFPANDAISATQFVPVSSVAPRTINTGQPLPAPARVKASDLYWGVNPGGQIRWSTGEQYEGSYVEMTDFFVQTYLNATNGTLNLVDADGNMVSTLDFSKYWTLRSHKVAGTTYTLPPLNAKIDTIRGYLTTNTGSETRGYLINPIYPGDIKVGAIYPYIANTSHRRDSVIVRPGVAPNVRIVASKQVGGDSLQAVYCYHRTNHSPWVVERHICLRAPRRFEGRCCRVLVPR
jgi:hypothetical protein